MFDHVTGRDPKFNFWYLRWEFVIARVWNGEILLAGMMVMVMVMRMARAKYKLTFCLLVFILTSMWMMMMIVMVMMMRG